jgi:hypothetical protein
MWKMLITNESVCRHLVNGETWTVTEFEPTLTFNQIGLRFWKGNKLDGFIISVVRVAVFITAMFHRHFELLNSGRGIVA